MRSGSRVMMRAGREAKSGARASLRQDEIGDVIKRCEFSPR